MTDDFDFGKTDDALAGGKQYYRCVQLPQGMELLKVKQAVTVSAIVIPYRTTKSPYTEPGKPWFMRDYYRYGGLGPDQKDYYFDMARTFNEKCPIGDAYREQNVRKNSQRMALFNLFVLTIDGQNVNKHMIIDFSFANFAQQLGNAKSAMAKRGKVHAERFMHPTQGAIITWDWLEKSFDGSKYFVANAFDFEPHNGLNGKVAELVNSAVDLDAALSPLSYEDAKTKFIYGSPVASIAASRESAPATRPSPASGQPASNSAPASKPASGQPAADASAVAAAQALATDDSPFDAGWE